MTLLNVVGVLVVLNVLYVPNVLNVLNVFNMLKDASLACWALFLDTSLQLYMTHFSQAYIRVGQLVFEAFFVIQIIPNGPN